MSKSIIAFTIGHTSSYDQALLDDPENSNKIGIRDDYDGGWIWKSSQEAQSFINSKEFLNIDWGDGKIRDPEEFSVYKVILVNDCKDISPIVGKDNIYHLLIDSKFYK